MIIENWVQIPDLTATIFTVPSSTPLPCHGGTGSGPEPREALSISLPTFHSLHATSSQQQTEVRIPRTLKCCGCRDGQRTQANSPITHSSVLSWILLCPVVHSRCLWECKRNTKTGRPELPLPKQLVLLIKRWDPGSTQKAMGNT